jgi:hypothetical protein
VVAGGGGGGGGGGEASGGLSLVSGRFDERELPTEEGTDTGFILLVHVDSRPIGPLMTDVLAQLKTYKKEIKS